MVQQQIPWSSFQSCKATNINNVPEMAGVYLVWIKLNNGEWACFYVGQANDLKSRLLLHLSGNEVNDCIKINLRKYNCGFEYASVGKQNDRDGIEKYLSDHYKPECNHISPPQVDPIVVNLP